MYKLLLVDDEREVIEGMKQLIDWEENDIVLCGEADNGAAAFEKALSLKPHIMVLDIRMPKVNGLELLYKLSEANIKIKFIVLSGYDDFSYAQQAINFNVVSYLLKPCRPTEILQAVLKAKTILVAENSKESISQQSKRNLRDNAQAELCVEDLEATSEFSRHIRNKTKNILIKTALDYIENNYSKDIDLETVAGHIYITSGYLSQLFKLETGINFLDYLNKFRIEKAKLLLGNRRFKTYEIAYKVGYSSEKYFSQMFKRYTGLSPKQFKEEAKISFTL